MDNSISIKQISIVLN